MKSFVSCVWKRVVSCFTLLFPVAAVKGLVQTAGSGLVVWCLVSGCRVIKDQS